MNWIGDKSGVKYHPSSTETHLEGANERKMVNYQTGEKWKEWCMALLFFTHRSCSFVAEFNRLEGQSGKGRK
jgi:hypothetical protein